MGDNQQVDLCINYAAAVLQVAVPYVLLTMNIKKYLALQGLEKMHQTISNETEKRDDVQNTISINMTDMTVKNDALDEEEKILSKKLQRIENIIWCIMFICLILLISDQLYLLYIFYNK